MLENCYRSCIYEKNNNYTQTNENVTTVQQQTIDTNEENMFYPMH